MTTSTKFRRWFWADALPFLSLSSIIISTVSFFLALFYLWKALFIGIKVLGWTTVVVLLSFFSGMDLFILGMLGEYTVKVLVQTGSAQSYHIKEFIGLNQEHKN